MNTTDITQKQIILGLGAVLTPIIPVMLVVLTLICFDFLTGVYASFRERQAISSRKIGNTVAKITLLNVGILSAFLIESYIVPEIPFVKVTAGFVAMVELTSILENIHRATGVNILKALKEWVSRQQSK